MPTVGRSSNQSLRRLPSVESLAANLDGPHHLAVMAARQVISEARRRLLSGELRAASEDELSAEAAGLVTCLAAGSVQRVVNATGVVLHTNLGRAPLAPEAAAAAAALAGRYTNLELDLATGERGSRDAHVSHLLGTLVGAEEAFAVNNNAAAVMLALGALASGKEVVIGRDQLVEIGGSFRIPEILAQSGARLVEVGTTNRVRVEDYEAAICPDTAALLRVHQSNFRTLGFVGSPTITELSELAQRRGIALIDDLGSGAIKPIADEPRVRESVAAGTDAVCFSADKLLGGPQAGIIAGSAAAIGVCRNHALARAVRIDKLQLAALEATLRLHRDRGPSAIPALRMLNAQEAERQRRADRMVELIGGPAEVTQGASRAGGGTLPTLELPGPVCAVSCRDAGALLARLRQAQPPVIARISDDRVLLDPTTMDDEEAAWAAQATVDALS